MTKHCTDKVDYNKFRPHGRVSFSIIEDYIVVYRALGPFNSEVLKALQEIEPDVLKQVKKKNDKWVEIVIFENSCMALDEFIDEFSLYIKVGKENNLLPLASAFVISSEVEGAYLMASKYKECYENAGLTFCVFENEVNATTWVKSFLS